MTTAPTPSPTPSPSPPGTTPIPSAEPTSPPTPTVGPTGETGFPSSIFGLDVHTVAGIYQLAADGRLDGRVAAVGGFWVQFALPCPYMPHQPVILGFCSGGSFADSPEEAQQQGGSVNGGRVPLAVPETSNSQLLWSDMGPFGGQAAMVVLIVHSADSREWQCAPADRSSCHSRLVIDSVAWANGSIVDLAPSNPDIGGPPTMTLDQVTAAAVRPGEQLVAAYPLLADGLNEVDPRFIGQGDHVVWYARVITGAPDATATAEGKDVLINDESREVVATLPLSVDPAYNPARLVLDVNGQMGQDGRTRFAIETGGRSVVKGILGSSSAPYALSAGDYTIHAWAISGAITQPPSSPGCDLALSVAAGDDLPYYADWPGGADCTWKEGEWPFN